MYNKIVSTNIIRIMREKKITQQTLAEKTGLSKSFLSEITRNIANPSLKILENIANSLEVPLPSLFHVNDVEISRLALTTNGEINTYLPKGYQGVYLILTDLQAFEAKQWDKENKKELKK